MKPFEIVAHRGVPTVAPENTLGAFQAAINLGADGVELDVRLTADMVPVVYHYFYLQENTYASGPIFNFTLNQLRELDVWSRSSPSGNTGRISTLSEVLDALSGKTGLEIEIKGPEPEAPEIIGKVLWEYPSIWHTIEVTSFQPALLQRFKKVCPGIQTDLLFPRSESWMQLDVVQYQALHWARLANARAVHLHPSQISGPVVKGLRKEGVEVHAWDVNDEQALVTAAQNDIPRICTDNLEQALSFRRKYP
jgi:glycerophosphoryl diester phosphodiesterase